MAKYYIADTHFFHNNVTKNGNDFDNRPFTNLEEMHETMLRNWNSVVTNADDVFIIGDCVWKENDESISFVSKLRAKKHLIVGNHCSLKDYRYTKLFETIQYQKTVSDTLNGKQQNVLLSHFPYFVWAKNRMYNEDGTPRKHDILLYGHVHNSQEYIRYLEYLKSLKQENKECRAYNVGCMLDYMNYTPRTLQEIVDNCKDV